MPLLALLRNHIEVQMLERQIYSIGLSLSHHFQKNYGCIHRIGVSHSHSNLVSIIRYFLISCSIPNPFTLRMLAKEIYKMPVFLRLKNLVSNNIVYQCSNYFPFFLWKGKRHLTLANVAIKSI